MGRSFARSDRAPDLQRQRSHAKQVSARSLGHPCNQMLKRWRKSPRVRQVTRRISDLQVLLYPPFALIIRVWSGLVRRYVRYDCRGPLFAYIRDGKPCIVAMWHQDVFPLMYELFRYTPTYPSYFMVSDGRVGTTGGYALNKFGVSCVLGSGSRSGVKAIEELSDRARRESRSVFVMADGSRGPARQARWGAVYLARNTGLPLVPVRAWGDNLMIVEKTWMKLGLPKPWGKAVLLSGEPIFIPPGTTDKEDLDGYRLELEKRLNELVGAADAYFTEGPSAVEALGPRIDRID